MNALWQNLHAGNGYAVFFFLVLADQAGFPLPAAPALIAAGVLARSGTVHVPVLMGLSVLASLLGHGAWYIAGRRRGAAIIKMLCRISFDPKACERRTEALFKQLGPMSLLWVRFIPGLDVLAQPLVAMAGVPPLTYFFITAVGAMLWSGILLGLGFALGHAGLSDVLAGASAQVITLVALAVVVYAGYRVALNLFSHHRDVPRLSPAALQAMLEAGRPLVIFDLRSRAELARSREHIASSKHLRGRELRQLARKPEPGLGAVVLCDCPKEAGSALYAAKLKRGGWENAWALEGGFIAWKQAGFPTRALGADAAV